MHDAVIHGGAARAKWRCSFDADELVVWDQGPGWDDLLARDFYGLVETGRDGWYSAWQSGRPLGAF